MSETVVDRLTRSAIDLGVTPAELRGSDSARMAVAAAAGLTEDGPPVRREQWRLVLPRLEAAHEDAGRRHGGPRGGAHCRACGAPMVWGQTELGKPLSVDPLPRPDGNVVRLPQGRRMVLRVIPRSALPVVGRPAYFAHFVTCPYGDQFRRRRRSSADGAPLPKCAVCGLGMDPWLADDGWVSHPCCAPNEKRSI